MNRSMELEVWGGDWGLPSIDINCLQVMVYSKFCGAPIQTKVRNNPFRGALPTFRHGNVTHYNLQDVVNYLRSKNLDADLSLTSKHVSEIQAYKQLLKEKLYPGLQFVWWVDNRNCVQLSKPWYSKSISFPFNFYYPGRYESQAKELITALYGPLDEDISVIETQVYSDAEKCITLLSNRLGDAKYFFGNQPTSLDAIVFSYLAPLLKPPFPNATLQNHLKACTNLVTFIARITQKYYPNISQDYERKKQEEIQKSHSDEEFPHRRRNQILAALFATTAMAGYALSSGMFEVSFSPEEETHDLTILDSTGDDDDDEE